MSGAPFRSPTVPEKHQTKHKPDGDTNHFVKSSKHVGAGHAESDNRMPHPQQDGFEPNEESGEGYDNMPTGKGTGF